MNFLGIDPGTQCGWGILDQYGHRIASGVWDLRPKRHEGGGMRYLRLDSYISETLRAIDVHALAYEEVRRHMGVDAAHVYGGIIAKVAEVCERREPKMPYQAIPVGTVKKLATGKGNAKKEAMIAAANARWGISVSDDNEADALWIAETLRVQLVGA